VDRLTAILLTLGAGVLVAFQPPANAQLSKHVGALNATFVSLLLSLLIIAVLIVFVGDVGDLRKIGEMRPEHLLGGIAGAAIVGVTLVTVGPLGAGGVVAVTVCTQLVVSAALDRTGVLGLSGDPITAPKLIGFAMLIVGTLLVTTR
jgi:transporter family-2 protein